MTPDPLNPSENLREWWCMTRDGEIVVSITGDFWGHKGHVHCVPSGRPLQENSDG